MKKILFLLLILAPMVSMAAPSVRVLGNKPANTDVVGAKITPAKPMGTTNANTSARLGTLRAKTGAISAASSRFPVITSAKVYSNVAIPNAGGNNSSTGGGSNTNPPVVSGDVDVTAIINAVKSDLRNEYYNRNDTYNRNEVYNRNETYNRNEVDARITEINNSLTEVNNAITDVTNNLDDSRFDAIRTTNPRTARNGADAPEGYVYIWIEE